MASRLKESVSKSLDTRKHKAHITKGQKASLTKVRKWKSDLIELTDGSQRVMMWKNAWTEIHETILMLTEAPSSTALKLLRKMKLEGIELPGLYPGGARDMTLADVFRGERLFPAIESNGIHYSAKEKFGKVSKMAKAVQNKVMALGKTLKAHPTKTLAENASFQKIFAELTRTKGYTTDLLAIYDAKIDSIKLQIKSSPYVTDTDKRKMTILPPAFGDVANKPYQFGNLRQAYSEFANSEFSPENMLFACAVRDLIQLAEEKKDYDTEIAPEMEAIYVNFVPGGAHQQINISSAQRTALALARNGGDWKRGGNEINLLDNSVNNPWLVAQKAIIKLTGTDAYKRFLSSKYYKNWKAGHKNTVDGRGLLKQAMAGVKVSDPEEEKWIANMQARLDNLARRADENEYDLYDSYEEEYVQGIDEYGYGQQPQQGELGQYDHFDDVQPNYHYQNGLYDPTLVVAGMAVFALLICCMFMVSVGVGFGCFVLGRMRRRNGVKQDEIVYDVVDQQGDDENI